MSPTCVTRGTANGNEIIGHVTHGGCENATCRRDIAEGRPWHATPMGFAITLDTYHYATEEEARQAIIDRMDGVPGRRLDLDVAADAEWRQGYYNTRSAS